MRPLLSILLLAIPMANIQAQDFGIPQGPTTQLPSHDQYDVVLITDVRINGVVGIDSESETVRSIRSKLGIPTSQQSFSADQTIDMIKKVVFVYTDSELWLDSFGGIDPFRIGPNSGFYLQIGQTRVEPGMKADQLKNSFPKAYANRFKSLDEGWLEPRMKIIVAFEIEPGNIILSDYLISFILDSNGQIVKISGGG